ncbi:MAG: putative DNA modification/repair radical SAM protein [Clostridia bacterium]|nr:putative DNA modification/repair radical SAM protein [Clostridia bacterium]
MELADKLRVLTESAKYDVACTSSGTDRVCPSDGIGSACSSGLCHAFAGDGRCISLLKILMSNACCYDCAYCVNRVSNDIPRATLTPDEIADITINFYRRNYIEGLFLSSGVIGNPDNTMQLMIKTIELLRYKHKFYGYVHAKAIPGAAEHLIERLGMLVDRMSSNIELPSSDSLRLLAPNKSRDDVLSPMRYISGKLKAKTKGFASAGQSTQMIIGATPESDLQIISLAEGLYGSYGLRRVFYSAYVAVADNSNLPAVGTAPPLLREHRLYQADWLMRYYGFKSYEILDKSRPYFNEYLDPKCNWAVNHPEFFPVDVNRADYERLLRVPGIGVKSARRILTARRYGKLDADALRRLGVVMKRAKYFIEGGGGIAAADSPSRAAAALTAMGRAESAAQLSLFDILPALGQESPIEV